MASGFFLFFKGNLPSKIFSEAAPKTGNVVIDSLLLEAFEQAKESSKKGLVDEALEEKENSSKDTLTSAIGDGNITLIEEGDLLSLESEDNFKGMLYLEPFFERLYELEHNKGKRVRIAYYGDSMTDGDLIVQDLRKTYQDTYGGAGVGYIPINVESAKSRGSIVHRYSANWKVQSFLNVKRPMRPFGVSGQVFFIKDTVKDTWISLQAGNIRNMTSLNSPTLYYGASNNKKGKVKVIIDRDTVVKDLAINGELNSLKLSNRSLRQIKLMFQSADSIPIYGIDVSAYNGVQVDNFSSRGNSGLPLSLFRVSLMQKFQRSLDYNLIILHYGTNVLNYGSLDYRWYTKQMGVVVNHLKQCFPNAAILVISTADKSSKKDMKMQTDPAVVPLVKAQRKYAMENHAGFLNLYEAMGGDGSMVKWVEESPNRANKDYTHFNHRGAQDIAKLIYQQLDEGYKEYRTKRHKKEGIKEESSVDSLQQKEKEENTTVVDTVENGKK
ncbi:hypothetical protein [Myroides albus]|uniref:SGNH hydrolase-type esterase domain-containing protein n=1 Tax=Myroides albus TaxID=2562892 RepID=A0A6I3LP05_9FLAO|nr:hypothetical protein [Myroides albus]MVX36895.1 hypothetical protein [Myroides sp. LoEW2-1]